MKVVSFPPTADVEKVELLAIVDQLRQSIYSGEIVGFAAVGLAADDTTTTWSAAVGRVTRLRMMGAVLSLQHAFCRGDL